MGKIIKQIFIERAKQIHDNKYDYSKVEYVNTYTKVCIICPTHGEFWQKPNDHLNKRGCPLCNKKRQLTTQDFIEKSKEIHGNKYDYSKVEYINTNTKVCIICPIHGEFWQIPNTHLRGSGCPLCKIDKTKHALSLTIEEFIEKAKQIHGNKYDYSKVNYKNNRTKVCIICPIHGEFWQFPDSHLKGCGCKKCGDISKSKKTEQFIKKAKQVHGDKYDYSKVEYINAKTKVCIICPTHGEFWQIPNNHIKGNSCPKCIYDLTTSNTEEFIEKAKKTHGDKYDYSKVVYKNNKTKVCIACPIHGEFLQIPNAHLRGVGCPKCNSSHLENEIREFLKNIKLDFTEQQKFKWLGKQSLDFYIPSKNIAIECQGIQHFKNVKHFKNKDSYIKDLRKKHLCEKNGVKMLYYSNLGISYPYQVFEDKDLLYEEIKKHDSYKR